MTSIETPCDAIKQGLHIECGESKDRMKDDADADLAAAMSGVVENENVRDVKDELERGDTLAYR